MARRTRQQQPQPVLVHQLLQLLLMLGRGEEKD